MTAYSPRAIVKTIKYTDLGASGAAKTFELQVPAGFWVSACAICPVTAWAVTSGGSITTINVKVGHRAGVAAEDLAALATEVDMNGKTVAQSGATADQKYMIDGRGVIDMDSDGTAVITVTPTYTGTLTAGEVFVVIAGFQLPYPA